MIAEIKKSPIAQVVTLAMSLSSVSAGVMAYAGPPKMYHAGRVALEQPCASSAEDVQTEIDRFKGEAIKLTDTLRALCLQLMESEDPYHAGYETLESIADNLRAMESDFRSRPASGGQGEFQKLLVESGLMRALAKARSQAATAAMLAKQKEVVPETFDGHVSGEAFRSLASASHRIEMRAN
ncbi:hypothetical protein [Halomonas sp.]|uniref:hypothetical protein n=1 Tax=Halomonas sp. TaxID=1486246 RepID=UPI00298E0C72|nr:hypothetical protein [Halomonas sp.]MDW7747706.1 hypothetical protein [Halomonas sp.]